VNDAILKDGGPGRFGRFGGQFVPETLIPCLAELDEAAYEWLGLAYYRFLGWTPALVPAP